MTFSQLYDENINKYGKYVMLIFEDKEFTNVELRKEAKRLANGLVKLGVNKGDRVVVCMPNCPEVMISYGAILRIGAIIIPILFLYQAEEIAYIVNDSTAETLITSNELLPKIIEVKKRAPTLKNIIVVGKIEDVEEQEGVIKYDELVEKEQSEFTPSTTVSEDDVAVIIYTSGTTGKPKGCMLTHKALYLNAKLVAEAVEVKEGEVGLHPLPLAHVYGIVVMIMGLLIKTTGILMKWFDTENAFKLIEKYKIYTMAGVPTIYAYMVNFRDADKYDTSSLIRCGCSAAALPAELLKKFEQKFKNAKIYEAYGLSESGGAVILNTPNMVRKLNSVGKPLPGIEVKIVDEQNNELPPYEIGEIIVKTPCVMKGYYNNPAATAEVIKEGFLYTGDVGYLDEDGYLFITERKKDMIIRGGINIYPKEIEEVILSHPKVSECAVVSVKDEVMGEEIKAVIVLKPSEKVEKEEIIEFCQKRLAKFKVPKYIEFRGFLPKNILGKVLKKELRGK